MAEPRMQRCPKCDGAAVKIFPSYGGKHGNLTAYVAECPCGTKIDDLSRDGTKRGAIRDWNRWAKEQRAAGVLEADDWQRPDNTCPRCKKPAANLFHTTQPGDELATAHCGCLYASGVPTVAPTLPQSLLDLIGDYGMARTDGVSDVERLHRWQLLIDGIKAYALGVALPRGCQCAACKVAPHASDCAVHNEPALPIGPCDCGATGHARKCGIYNFAGDGKCTCGYDDVLPRRKP